MTAIEHFATATVRSGEQLPFWNRLASETFSGLVVDCGREDFPAEMWRWSMGELTMIRPRSPAAIVQHRVDTQRRRDDLLTLHLQHRGRARHRQFGHECDMAAGDLVLAASDADYRIDVSDANDMLVVEMPRAAIAARVPDHEAKIGRRIVGAAPGSRLLHDFVLSLWQQGDQSGADPAWQAGVLGVFFDLLALAIRDPAAGQPVPRRPDERLLALVEAQLADPELRAATLADALGVSTRSIQNMFAGMGATPSGYILERRLARAADRLAADRLAADGSISITAVAFDLGFNDSAYFARCFRQRFGTTPSRYRARH